MNGNKLVGLGLLALAAWMAWVAFQNLDSEPTTPPAPTQPAPVPPAPLCPGPDCPKKPKPRPWGGTFQLAVRKSSLEIPFGYPLLDGPTHQGIEVQCDLPPALRLKNIGGTDGAGLCVFTSINHAARFQNEKDLWDFQRQMSHEPGGGYPEKVDRMLAKYAPKVHYVQYEGNDLSVLEKVLASGRMPAVTYDGRDPNYGPLRIAHMVNLIHLDKNWAVILDNNFIKDGEQCWMTREEFASRWRGGDRLAWAVFLSAPAPAPIPQKP